MISGESVMTRSPYLCVVASGGRALAGSTAAQSRCAAPRVGVKVRIGLDHRHAMPRKRLKLPPIKRVRIFEPEDVLSLLRFEVQQAGSQLAWAKKS
jgi:hypothetical protein